jgi:hypothetical protein
MARTKTIWVGGDEGVYTGEMRILHGKKFWVVRMLEGRFAGQEKVVGQSPDGDDDGRVAETKAEYREMQEGFRRLKNR